MTEEPAGRAGQSPVDRWLVAGLVLLAVLSVAALLLYRSAPRTLAEARTGSWVAAAPNTAAANLARGRERFERAIEAAAAGNDSAAIALDSVAAEHAWRAGEAATDDAARRDAAELWAATTLHRADLLRLRGTGTGLRPDDNTILREALDLVTRVDSLSPLPEAQVHADSLRALIERQLRPGPLEWLPR